MDADIIELVMLENKRLLKAMEEHENKTTRATFSQFGLKSSRSSHEQLEEEPAAYVEKRPHSPESQKQKPLLVTYSSAKSRFREESSPLFSDEMLTMRQVLGEPEKIKKAEPRESLVPLRRRLVHPMFPFMPIQTDETNLDPSSKLVIKLSAKHFDSQGKVREEYLMNTIKECIGQSSSGPRFLYLEFLVDLTELELELGQQVASQVTSTGYHSTQLHSFYALRWVIFQEKMKVSFLVNQSQVGCPASERTIRSFYEAFCYLRKSFIAVQSVDLSNCTLPTQVALLNTFLSDFDITFDKRHYMGKLVCIFSKDFFRLRENEFMSIIDVTKPLVVQGKVSKQQFQELIIYSFLLLTEYNEKVTHALIAAGADVNMTDKDGRTALYYATDRDNEKIALALIEAGADVNMTDKDGKTALIYATDRCNEKVAHALIKAGADVNMTDKDGKTALIYATDRYNEKVAHALIKAGADVNMTDKDGKTALFYSDYYVKVTHALIAAGADVNMTDKDGKTALFYVRYNEKIALALIEAGADVNMTDKDCKTALFYSDYNVKVTNALIEAGADVNMTDKDGKTALFYSDYNVKVTNALIEAGADVNMTDEDGKTALFYSDYNVKVTNALIEAGADVNMTDKDGKTALFYSDYNVKVTNALIEAGADVNMTDEDGKTALFYATGRNNGKIALALIEAGADVNMTDEDGKTALFYATGRNNGKIALALIEAGADVNSKDTEGNTLLLLAFDRPNNIRRMCEILLEAGSSLCETTSSQETVFHLALNICQQKILSSNADKRQKHLLWLTILDAFKLFSESSEGKVAVNKRDMDLNSPLHLWASLVLASPHQYREDVFERMLKECLELLVKCGIKLNYSNKQEQTPLHVCRTWTAVKLLLDAGAKPDVTDSSGCPPLLFAAKRNTCIKKDSELFYPDVTETPKEFWKEVIDKKLDPWTADKDGHSVLSVLIQKEAYCFANALIEVACELKCVQSDAVGVPLLVTICRDKSVDKEWKVDLVKTLLKYRNSLAQKRASDEDTALHFCCRTMVELPEESAKISVHWKIAKYLILCGADVETPGTDGQSCLDMAESCPVLKQLVSMPANPDEVSPLIDLWKTVSSKHQHLLTEVSRGFNCQQFEAICYSKEALDRGTFGLVFVGINREDGKEVAVKRVEAMRVDKQSTIKEIEELRRVTSSNKIIQCLLCTSDKDFLYVILELMEGNLDDLLSDENRSCISQETKLCRDICAGLDYLHNRHILHKGIKPSNILYQVLPSGLNLKLAFFGLRSQMSKDHHASDYRDTFECLIKERCWMAPEVLQSQNHSQSSDVFSCGLVIHYLLSNKKHPFGVPGSSEESRLTVSIETVDNIAQDKMELDETLSSDAKDLLKGMLDHSAPRPSISDALKHWFFQSTPENTERYIYYV